MHSNFKSLSSQDNKNMESKMPSKQSLTAAKEIPKEEYSDNEEMGHLLDNLNQVIRKHKVDSEKSYETDNLNDSSDSDTSNDSIIHRMKGLATDHFV